MMTPAPVAPPAPRQMLTAACVLGALDSLSIASPPTPTEQPPPPPRAVSFSKPEPEAGDNVPVGTPVETGTAAAATSAATTAADVAARPNANALQRSRPVLLERSSTCTARPLSPSDLTELGDSPHLRSNAAAVGHHNSAIPAPDTPRPGRAAGGFPAGGTDDELSPQALARSGTLEHPLQDHVKYEALSTADMCAGAFGVVHLARNRRTGHQVAIKCIELRRIFTDRARRYILSEVLNHRVLRHPSVVQFHEVFLTRYHVAIVMDYANGGNLLNYLKLRGGRLNEAASRWFFQQLIMGVDYCHRMGVVNRDIKLENTLVHMQAGIPLPLVKICDFGYSKGYWMSMPKSKVGTFAYMAPEVLRATGGYDARLADIWSCGVVLFSMLFGTFPFGQKGCYAEAGRIPALPWGRHHQEVSPECRALLSALLTEPTQRLSMAQLVANPWFATDLPPGALVEVDACLARGINGSAVQAEEEICGLLGESVPAGVISQRSIDHQTA